MDVFHFEAHGNVVYKCAGDIVKLFEKQTEFPPWSPRSGPAISLMKSVYKLNSPKPFSQSVCTLPYQSMQTCAWFRDLRPTHEHHVQHTRSNRTRFAIWLAAPGRKSPYQVSRCTFRLDDFHKGNERQVVASSVSPVIFFSEARHLRLVYSHLGAVLENILVAHQLLPSRPRASCSAIYIAV